MNKQIIFMNHRNFIGPIEQRQICNFCKLHINLDLNLFIYIGIQILNLIYYAIRKSI